MAKASRKAERPARRRGGGRGRCRPGRTGRSGWTPHPSERRDFYHRIRVFPADVSAWRRRLLDRLRTGRPPLPLTTQPDPETVCDRLDDGICYLRVVARILAVLHGTPDLGNKPDPTDERVYIILSRKTPLQAILGLGLASETLSGLSEEGHSGGKFPRPCLSERLGRVLERAKPEVVVDGDADGPGCPDRAVLK